MKLPNIMSDLSTNIKNIASNAKTKFTGGTVSKELNDFSKTVDSSSLKQVAQDTLAKTSAETKDVAKKSGFLGTLKSKFEGLIKPKKVAKEAVPQKEITKEEATEKLTSTLKEYKKQKMNVVQEADNKRIEDLNKAHQQRVKEYDNKYGKEKENFYNGVPYETTYTVGGKIHDEKRFDGFKTILNQEDNAAKAKELEKVIAEQKNILGGVHSNANVYKEAQEKMNAAQKELGYVNYDIKSNATYLENTTQKRSEM